MTIQAIAGERRRVPTEDTSRHAWPVDKYVEATALGTTVVTLWYRVEFKDATILAMCSSGMQFVVHASRMPPIVDVSGTQVFADTS